MADILKTNYVLIDYENVQPDDIAALEHEHFRVIVFVGAHQSKIAFQTAEALHRLGGKAEYVKLSSSGSNALDFHIAFYLGQLAAKEPTAYFHIISKDTGFDPLVSHLKERNVRACRVKAVEEIPLLKAGGAKPKAERLKAERLPVVVTDLRKRGAARPRTVATLSSTINSLFKKQLSAGEVASLVAELKSRGLITVSGTKVSYNLPA
jgi:PIN domain